MLARLFCSARLVTPGLSRDCVPAWLQASLLGFFSSGRFQLEEFGISKPSDRPQHLGERDFGVFNHVTFYGAPLSKSRSDVQKGAVFAFARMLSG